MTEIETPISDALSKSHNAIFRRRKSRKFSGQESENAVRMHRAISWLRCWEKCRKISSSPDEQFVFLWIAFNAAYAAYANPDHESEKIQKFLNSVIKRDGNNSLAKIIDSHRDDFSKINDNEYLLREYWRTRTREGLANVRSKKGGILDKSLTAQNALRVTKQTKAKTNLVLTLTFARLYILRNQVLHGAATHGGDFNRSSIEPGTPILGACVPAFLKIMLDAMRKQPAIKVWGKVEYPPHQDKPDPVNPDPPPRRNY